MSLGEDALGILVGDVVVETRGKLVRVEVQRIRVYSSSPAVMLSL